MSQTRIFVDLPAALVEELLGRTSELSRSVIEQLTSQRTERERWRDVLARERLLGTLADLPAAPTPTTCGVDGSVAVERLLAHDLLVAGALAIEGLTPPSEKRFWPEPRHLLWVELVPHDDANDALARALMAASEVELAARAPHDVVFLDGSLTTPLIAFDQALRALATRELPSPAARVFLEALPERLDDLARVLCSADPPRCWVGVPKYTARRDLAIRLGLNQQFDDRALLTILLAPGEFTWPILATTGRRPHAFGLDLLPDTLRPRTSSSIERMLRAVDRLRVVYVRSHPWLPALRLELHESVAVDSSRLASVLQAVHDQTASGKLREPFPLYLADRMVRSLRRATRALRHAVRETAARGYPVLDDVFLALESYRSESLSSP
jgi:hypothetical protein